MKKDLPMNEMRRNDDAERTNACTIRILKKPVFF